MNSKKVRAASRMSDWPPILPLCCSLAVFTLPSYNFVILKTCKPTLHSCIKPAHDLAGPVLEHSKKYDVFGETHFYARTNILRWFDETDVRTS